MGNPQSCGGCGGNCSGCAGCSASMELTAGEMGVLQTLGQYSFLPVARRREDMVPVYLEDSTLSREEYGLVLQCLEKRGLIDISYDAPLKGADMSAYVGYPVHGSIGLTQRGQQVLEFLEMQGIEEDTQ